MGEKGSFILNEKEKHYFPALKIDVVDTTGAGDEYVAGFIANLVRAKIITSVGATSGLRPWRDLVEFGEKYGVKI